MFSRFTFGRRFAHLLTYKYSEYPCDDVSGILQWTDWPDPAGARPVNSRLAVTITDEKGLCTRLKSMGHK